MPTRFWRKKAGPLLSSFTIIAASRMMGAVSASNRTLAMMSNRRLAKPESRRPEENPSEKMNQLGLTLSRSTRPVSRSRKLERSLTCRSEEHTSELQSLMRISYAVFCLKKKKKHNKYKQD